MPTVSDKPRYVADMFGRIAARYDLWLRSRRWGDRLAEAAEAGAATAGDAEPGEVRAVRP